MESAQSAAAQLVEISDRMWLPRRNPLNKITRQQHTEAKIWRFKWVMVMRLRMHGYMDGDFKGSSKQSYANRRKLKSTCDTEMKCLRIEFILWIHTIQKKARVIASIIGVIVGNNSTNPRFLRSKSGVAKWICTVPAAYIHMRISIAAALRRCSAISALRLAGGFICV